MALDNVLYPTPYLQLDLLAGRTVGFRAIDGNLQVVVRRALPRLEFGRTCSAHIFWQIGHHIRVKFDLSRGKNGLAGLDSV